jgi:hypothetical protein
MFADVLGCPGQHAPWKCRAFRNIRAEERARIIEDNRLCAFCLLHDRAVACRTRENRTKPACGVPECVGRHAIWLHELLKDIYEEKGRVHLVQGDGGWRTPEEAWMEDEMEGEEEVMFVNTVQQEEDDWQEPDNSWLELEGGESGEEAGVYCIGACLGQGDPGLGDEREHPPGVSSPSENERARKVRWWSPGSQGLQLDKENEEGVQYLVSLLMGGLEIGSEDPEPTRPRAEAALASGGCDRRALEGEAVKGREGPQENAHGGLLPPEGKPREGAPGKKEVCGERDGWGTARRGLLANNSKDEPEGECIAGVESSQWRAEMMKNEATLEPRAKEGWTDDGDRGSPGARSKGDRGAEHGGLAEEVLVVARRPREGGGSSTPTRGFGAEVEDSVSLRQEKSTKV